MEDFTTCFEFLSQNLYGRHPGPDWKKILNDSKRFKGF